MDKTKYIPTIFGILLSEVRDAVKYPTMHKTVCETKNYPATNILSAKAENKLLKLEESYVGVS